MRKPELAAAIADRADLSKDKASQVLNVILDEITGSVSQGQDVSLIGFGTFTVRERAARTGKKGKKARKPILELLVPLDAEATSWKQLQDKYADGLVAIHEGAP